MDGGFAGDTGFSLPVFGGETGHPGREREDKSISGGAQAIKTSQGLRPICSVDNGRQQAALTFDLFGLEEGAEGILPIMDVLDREQVKATFLSAASGRGAPKSH